MSQEVANSAKQSFTEIKANLEVIQGAFRLGARGSPRKMEVPVGHVVVLSYGHEFADASGLPEVYFAGEVVQRDPKRKGVPCWAVQLSEFPGRVDLQARQVLAAISQSEDDPASIRISFYIRLYDPILLLRRIGGKWEQEADRASFNRQIQADVESWLRSLLERDIQIWSGDERDVLGRIFYELDEFLRRMGLRVDTTDGGAATSAMIFTRYYPPALYDLSFQFAQAERLLRHLFQQGANIPQATGLSEEDVHRIAVSEDRAGTALFRTLMDAAPGVKEKIAQWLEASGKREAASFIKTLYKKYQEREIKLSEQVLLSAIRNPWLTQGEWLKEMSESPATRFQQIERRVRSIPLGS
jgi:hypothetical protein